jgi:hypothetical protein
MAKLDFDLLRFTIEQAESGDIASARELIGLLAQHLRDCPHFPASFKDYLVPKFDTIAKNSYVNAGSELNLSGKQGKKNPEKLFQKHERNLEIAIKIKLMIRKENISINTACKRLASSGIYTDLTKKNEPLSEKRLCAIFTEYEDLADLELEKLASN